jgi:hypothetical protein
MPDTLNLPFFQYKTTEMSITVVIMVTAMMQYGDFHFAKLSVL